MVVATLTATSAVSLAIWIYLLAFHGRFWLVRDDGQRPLDVAAKSVAVVIPARDEAATIGLTVRSLLRQEYGGCVSVFVVDDHSTDVTAALAREAGAEVIAAKPLPSGWTGKMWAVSQGLEQAMAIEPDYVLLTDADIEHGPNSIRNLVARAERDQLDLTSYMVRLENSRFAERATIPAFVFFFFELYPPSWIADRSRRTAGAAGGCMLVRASALKRIGGVERIKGEIIDDCALAREIKQSGGRLWLGLTSTTRSLRSYGNFGEIAHMISRTAFTQLRHSGLLLVGTVLGMLLIYVVPSIAALSGAMPATALGTAAWLIMGAMYVPMLRFYGQSLFWAPFLPAVAAFYTVATVQSAVSYWRGKGGAWKGRIQDVRN